MYFVFTEPNRIQHFEILFFDNWCHHRIRRISWENWNHWGLLQPQEVLLNVCLARGHNEGILEHINFFTCPFVCNLLEILNEGWIFICRSRLLRVWKKINYQALAGANCWCTSLKREKQGFEFAFRTWPWKLLLKSWWFYLYSWTLLKITWSLSKLKNEFLVCFLVSQEFNFWIIVFCYV